MDGSFVVQLCGETIEKDIECVEGAFALVEVAGDLIEDFLEPVVVVIERGVGESLYHVEPGIGVRVVVFGRAIDVVGKAQGPVIDRCEDDVLDRVVVNGGSELVGGHLVSACLDEQLEQLFEFVDGNAA